MWTTVADKAFHQLKQVFTSAPILKHPDPERPFVVEVDASDTVVLVVKLKIYPETFFFRN